MSLRMPSTLTDRHMPGGPCPGPRGPFALRRYSLDGGLVLSDDGKNVTLRKVRTGGILGDDGSLEGHNPRRPSAENSTRCAFTPRRGHKSRSVRCFINDERVKFLV